VRYGTHKKDNEKEFLPPGILLRNIRNNGSIMENFMFDWLKRKRKNLPRLKEIENYSAREAEFLPAGLEVVETPPTYAGRIAVWTIAALMAAILLWSIFGTVDEVAVTTGKIIPDGYVRTLQAYDKGIVRTIYVTEGQKVSKGDVLMELDPTISEADLAKVRKQAAYARLRLERLQAEKNGGAFHPDRNSTDLDEKEISSEQALFASREADYHTRLYAAQQEAAKAEAELRSSKIDLAKLRSLYAIEADKENRYAALVDEAAIAEISLIDQRGRRIAVEESANEQEETVSGNSAALSKAIWDLANVKAERQLSIDQEIDQTQQELFQANEELKKAAEQHELIKILAPDDGYVSNLQVHTLGSVVTTAQALMELVPEGTRLEIETWAQNKDIGFLQEGQEADVKIESFDYQKYGVVSAKLTNISPNSIEDPEQGRVYRLLLTPEKDTIDIEGRKVPLSSGMNVTAEIKTRKKHIYEFFLEPFKTYKSEFLRER
jgi:type I secretion membrane fusion protein, hlyD family